MSRLAVEGLTFSYSSRSAPLYDDLTVRFDPGKTVLLGRNGAGKTTLLSLCAGVFEPRKGVIVLNGVPRTKSTRAMHRKAISFLPQHIPILDGFTVQESVRYAGWLKGLSRKDAYTQATKVLERVGLSSRAHSKATRLSGGELRRMGIAQALVHEAEVLLLDEPAAGLDPIQQGELRNLLADIDPRIQLIVSTHQTQDIDAIYDSVLVVDAGKVLWQGSVSEFTQGVPSDIPVHMRAEWVFETLIRRSMHVTT
ncbi:ATP-binding cassette domain-containing protein [Timonella sp. A28]|uniref:ATP-binding cassette domain-containing protein n=1 Tax=Timonella sp. A28 TaxID=3442640 RepID=UPI003EC15283